jgi:hypothetical protein
LKQPKQTDLLRNKSKNEIKLMFFYTVPT